MLLFLLIIENFASPLLPSTLEIENHTFREAQLRNSRFMVLGNNELRFEVFTVLPLLAYLAVANVSLLSQTCEVVNFYVSNSTLFFG